MTAVDNSAPTITRTATAVSIRDLVKRYGPVEAVRGRTTGLPRSNPVDLWEHGSRHYVCLLYTSPSPRDA